MVVSCILRQAQSRIPALALIDSGASAYAFIDKTFAQNHRLPLHPLKYPRRLRGFDGQAALTGDITHVAETTMALGGHIERLFFYVTGLNQYPIVMGLPWLKRHAIEANFGSDTLTMSSPFCLAHCCQSPAKVSSSTREEIAFLSPKESQRIWELEDQQNPAGGSVNLVVTQPARKEHPRVSTVQKEQSESQFSSNKQAILPPARKEHPRISTVQKEQSNPRPVSKKPTCTQSAQKEQPSPLLASAKHVRPLAVLEQPSPVPSSLEEEPPSRVLQAIHKGYKPQIKYRSSPSRLQPPIQLNIVELGACGFDRATRTKESEIFSLSLRDLDRFLGISPPVLSQPAVQLPAKPVPSPRSRPPSRPTLTSSRSYDQDHNLALYQMEQEFHLATTTTQEDLEAYRKSKDVDLATILPAQYHAFLHVFSRKEADTLPTRGPYDHAINLEEGAKPPASALYGMSRNEALELRRYLDENLSKGFIRASRSESAAPVLFVKKPGGGLRFCVDYRSLNAITVKNRYPLPLISETLNRLSRAKIFTKLDIIAAFNRLRIRAGDEKLTAFRTRFGLFEYLVMPFGLCNGPASFQNYINDTLREYLDDFCTAYLDDILIYSDCEAEHELHVNRVLKKLGEAGLQVDITKCAFHVTEVPYLGLIITTEGIRMDPAKVDTIVNWPTLINVKDVQSFLGFANFYRRFIYGYSKLAAPLTQLTKKDIVFNWTPDYQKAFDALKNAFTSEVILKHYNPDIKIVVETDASDYVSGGILSQYDENDVLHPIAYFSKKHNPAECNYEIYDKELMAIVRAFEEWRPELEGSATPIDVITDHKNLEYFMSTKQLSRRQARWSEFLSRFNYHITYRPGKAGGKPDALTHRSGDLPKEGDTQDPRHLYQHQTVLKSHVLDPRIQEDLSLTPRTLALQNRIATLDPIQLHLSPMPPLLPTTLAPMDLDRAETEPDDLEPQLDLGEPDPDNDPADVPTQTLWEQAESNDQFAPQVLEALRSGARHHSKIPLAECEERDNSLYFRERKYVPNSDRLRLRIIQLAHDSTAGGHLGRSKYYELVSQAYWWPNIYKYIQRFVRNCHVCSRAKPSRQRTQGWLRPLPVPERRWRDVSMDYVGPLPASTFMGVTYRYVLVFVDRLTKMRHLVPTATMEVEEAAHSFYAYVWKNHGLPESFVSDRGTQFTSDVWKHLCQMLRIDAKLSTAYHPQTDDQTERPNAIMEHYLRAFVNYIQDDWAKWIPSAEFAANNAPSATTLASPFLANSGQNPRLGFEPPEPLPADMTAQSRRRLIDIENFTKKMEDLTTHLRDEMLVAQAIYESNANRSRRPCPRYLVGDQVWLDAKNLNTARPVVKLDDDNVGPFPVKRVFRNPLIIELELPTSMKVHPVFHASLLSHVATDPLPGQRQEPREPIFAENGERAWYVNAILNSKMDRRYNPPLLKYYVDWEGDFPTWEPFYVLDNCQQAIDEYHAATPNAEGPHLTPCTIDHCQCKDSTSSSSA